jgi:hypothetical protein
MLHLVSGRGRRIAVLTGSGRRSHLCLGPLELVLSHQTCVEGRCLLGGRGGPVCLSAKWANRSGRTEAGVAICVHCCLGLRDMLRVVRYMWVLTVRPVLCQSLRARRRQHVHSYLFLLLAVLASSLDTVPTLDHIGLETDGPRPAVQLEKESTGIAEHRSVVVAPPQRRRARGAILADGLKIVSDGSGHVC